MLAAEIRAMHGSTALPASMGVLIEPSKEPNFIPSESTIAALTSEMENLLIDKRLQSHPVLRGYWEAAIQRRREDLKGQDLSNLTLPSPPKSLSPPHETTNDSESAENALDRLPSTRELPSPRPSPPRQLAAPMPSSSPGYVRGRSMSC